MEQKTLELMMNEIGKKSAQASHQLATASTEQKNATLQSSANLIRKNMPHILSANAKDLNIANTKGLNKARIDRIALDEERLEGVAQALENIINLPDPVGAIMQNWQRPNKLDITRIRVPLGVIGVIYESRPNVTADAAALCLKSGNSVILRGSSEIQNSAQEMTKCFTQALQDNKLPQECIQLVPTVDRDAVGFMLSGLNNTVNVIVPRGGRNLVERIQNEARVPVFSHLDGICHSYVDKDADLEMAKAIILNAKLRRAGICGATETLLIDEACAKTHLAPIIMALLDENCEIRGDETVQNLDARIVKATPQDWDTEYLDEIISVKLCQGVTGAIEHIARHSSGHTEAIITDNKATAEQFLHYVDSAIVMHNSSTQFADGGEFGMGAEIGIATGRFHARGPVGLEQLTTFKYQIRGNGQIRPK